MSSLPPGSSFSVASPVCWPPTRAKTFGRSGISSLRRVRRPRRSASCLTRYARPGPLRSSPARTRVARSFADGAQLRSQRKEACSPRLWQDLKTVRLFSFTAAGNSLERRRAFLQGARCPREVLHPVPRRAQVEASHVHGARAARGDLHDLPPRIQSEVWARASVRSFTPTALLPAVQPVASGR